MRSFTFAAVALGVSAVLGGVAPAQENSSVQAAQQNGSWISIEQTDGSSSRALMASAFGLSNPASVESWEAAREPNRRAPSVIGVAEDTTAPVVTPVGGPSWIKRLGLPSTRSTAMGRMGGNAPPPVSRRKEPGRVTKAAPTGGRMGRIIERFFTLFRTDRRKSSSVLNETFVLTGADLYRLNCQSCHGPDGQGAPPEIKSLVDPVRGTSPTLIRQRMEKMGRSIDEEMARELAADAEKTLRERLQKGGEKMPDFKHLRGDEVEALLQYLKKLAGVPSADRKDIVVTQSVARVGEHIVKGTCHICHDATGPGPGHMAMMRGIIPSLASFPNQLSMQQMIRQVKWGSSPMMSMMGGDTMPPFPYFTEEELAAAYLYLLEYPPQP